MELLHLANAMHGVTNLMTLSLSNNSIGPDGATALATVLHFFNNLSDLDLSDNNIEPAGAISLANGLVYLTKLRCLYLSGNCIDLSSISSVIRAMKNCNYLQELIFNGKRRDGIHVEGLVSPDDAAGVAELVAATQHQTQNRLLYLGFKTLTVPSKISETNCTLL